jgi:hypothetical protein
MIFEINRKEKEKERKREKEIEKCYFLNKYVYS